MDPRLFAGTLDLLILEVVSRAPSYGYEISQQVLDRSKGEFELKEGSLYPALHRLERAKMLSTYWIEADSGRRRKYYKLTAPGARELARKREEWDKFTGAVKGVLGETQHGMA